MKAASGNGRDGGEMTRPSGNTLAALLVAVLLAMVATARAEVSVAVDRNQVAIGDTLRLTITATEDGEEVSGADLGPLEKDFEVLQRSTRSQTSIVNGRRSHTRQLQLDITPRREGELEIPALQIGQAVTRPLRISVGPAPALAAADETVLFEMEVDRDSVYVQGQLILTLRLQQAINLDNRSISDLQLDNAFVVPLEQKSFQRTVDGRPWLVHEVRYAIFPEQSGTLEIPAQSFSARESDRRRSMFDIGRSGRVVRRTAGPVAIDVLPRPDSYPSTTWLPARNLTIQERWSSPPEQMKAGDSVTRTIEIRGEGLQGAQLPPILFPATDGLKYYPDQPVINDVEVGTGLLGTRQDSAALVPTRAGEWDIPEIRIPWWDIESGELRYAVVPARRISVAPPAQPHHPPATVPGTDSPIPAAPGPAVRGDALPWKIIAAASSIGWLLTVAYLLFRRHSDLKRKEPNRGGAGNDSEPRAFRQVLSACKASDPRAARRALLDWGNARFPDSALYSLAQLGETSGDAALGRELEILDTALYSPGAAHWDGKQLADIVSRLRTRRPAEAGEEDGSFQLYPGTT